MTTYHRAVVALLNPLRFWLIQRHLVHGSAWADRALEVVHVALDLLTYDRRATDAACRAQTGFPWPPWWADHDRWFQDDEASP